MIFATVSRVCLFTRKQLWSNYWVCAECLLASFTCSFRTGGPCLAARPKRWREQDELAAALRLLLQVDAVRMCVIEVTLVLYQRGPGLPAGGNAAETGPDTGEGCWRKKGPGGGWVPASQNPHKGHLCSQVFTFTVQGGKPWQWCGFWCRSADRKALLERKWFYRIK